MGAIAKVPKIEMAGIKPEIDYHLRLNLFEQLRHKTYRVAGRTWPEHGYEQFEDCIRYLAKKINAKLPIPETEAKLEKTVARDAGWAWKNMVLDRDNMPEPKRRGLAISLAIELANLGKSIKSIAKITKFSAREVSDWLKEAENTGRLSKSKDEAKDSTRMTAYLNQLGPKMQLWF